MTPMLVRALLSSSDNERVVVVLEDVVQRLQSHSPQICTRPAGSGGHWTALNARAIQSTTSLNLL